MDITMPKIKEKDEELNKVNQQLIELQASIQNKETIEKENAILKKQIE